MTEAYVRPEEEGPRSGRLGGRLAGWFAPDSTAPTWAGLVTAGLGFALLAFGWGRVAGLTNVALQVPYIVSAGFTGLGLIAVGCTLVAVQARRQDAAARDRRLAELEEVLEVLERLAQRPASVEAEAAAPEPSAEPARRRPRAPVKKVTPRRPSSSRRPRKAAAG